MITETLNIDGTESLRTLKSLRQELKATRDEMLNLEQGTEEYNEALKKAGNLQHELREQLLEINANADDFGQKLGNCAKAINGMMGAVTAVTGAISLMGIENDEAAKKITATMTSLLGIVKGLEKIDTGIKAFKRLKLAVEGNNVAMKAYKAIIAWINGGTRQAAAGTTALTGAITAEAGATTAATVATKALRAALISTGIGAIVVLVGTLIAHLEDLVGWINKFVNSEQASKKAAEEEAAARKELNEKLREELEYRREIRRYLVTDATQIDLLNDTRDAINDVTNAGKHYEKQQQALIDNLRNFKIAGQSALDGFNDWKEALNDKHFWSEATRLLQGDELQDLRQIFIDLGNLEKKQQEERKKRADDAAKAEDAARKKREASTKARIDSLKKLYKYELDLSETISKDKDYKYTDEGKAAYIKYYDDLSALYKKNSEDYKQVQLDKLKYLNDYEAHFQAITDAEIKKEKELAEANEKDRLGRLSKISESLKSDEQKLLEQYNQLVIDAQGNAQDLLNVETWYQQELAKIKEQETAKVQEEAEKQKQIEMAKVNAYMGVASAIGGIFGSISDCMEDGTREQKAMATASATIQMLLGIATAMSGAFTTKSGPWDIALAVAQAAAIAASGAASIVQINKVTTTGSGTSNVTVPSINMSSVMGASSDFNYTMDGAATEAAIQDQRVYVTEHDITSTQNRVRVAENEARY